MSAGLFPAPHLYGSHAYARCPVGVRMRNFAMNSAMHTQASINERGSAHPSLGQTASLVQGDTSPEVRRSLPQDAEDTTL